MSDFFGPVPEWEDKLETDAEPHLHWRSSSIRCPACDNIEVGSSLSHKATCPLFVRTLTPSSFVAGPEREHIPYKPCEAIVDFETDFSQWLNTVRGRWAQFEAERSRIED